mmetsp:Transcript_79887/g.141004  ORF Transcript_79887/g.141004 Transcript_79887/m.141004 type:complete len:96 (-) Transcript_79887:626-913(-)
MPNLLSRYMPQSSSKTHTHTHKQRKYIRCDKVSQAEEQNIKHSIGVLHSDAERHLSQPLAACRWGPVGSGDDIKGTIDNIGRPSMPSMSTSLMQE